VRALPSDVRARIDLDAWQPDPIFDLVAAEGPVAEEEMFRAFNMGIGKIVIIGADDARRVISRAGRLGETCLPIGWIDSAPSKEDTPRRGIDPREPYLIPRQPGWAYCPSFAHVIHG